MRDNLKPNSQEGISPRLKIAVIGLTILTCAAGTIFFIMFFQKLNSSFGRSSWGSQLLTVAEKLEKNNLPEQAIRTYLRFLNQSKPDKNTRIKISFKLAKLYKLNNNCAETISWLFEAEAASPKIFIQNKSAKDLFEHCQKKLMDK